MEEEEYKEAITSMQVPHLLWTHMLRVNTLNQFKWKERRNYGRVRGAGKLKIMKCEGADTDIFLKTGKAPWWRGGDLPSKQKSLAKHMTRPEGHSAFRDKKIKWKYKDINWRIMSLLRIKINIGNRKKQSVCSLKQNVTWTNSLNLWESRREAHSFDFLLRHQKLTL